MKEWITKDEYQNWADVIRSEQVPMPRVIQVMEENPSLLKWYKKKYLNKTLTNSEFNATISNNLKTEASK